MTTHAKTDPPPSKHVETPKKAPKPLYTTRPFKIIVPGGLPKGPLTPPRGPRK